MKDTLTRAVTHREFLKMCGLALVGAGAGQVVAPPKSAAAWSYDGDSVRRKRLDNNGTIHYLGRYERNVGNGMDTAEKITKYYYAGFGKVQRLVAFRCNGVLYWVGTDH